MPTIGDTFRLSRQDGHLWIIIADVDNKLVIVSVTSLTENVEDTCILGKGDHPFITHPSVISYKDIREFPRAGMARGLKSRDVIACEPVSPRVLRKIQDCALKPNVLGQRFREAIRSCLIEP
jgi:hypothetical protein